MVGTYDIYMPVVICLPMSVVAFIEPLCCLLDSLTYSLIRFLTTHLFLTYLLTGCREVVYCLLCGGCDCSLVGRGRIGRLAWIMQHSGHFHCCHPPLLGFMWWMAACWWITPSLRRNHQCHKYFPSQWWSLFMTLWCPPFTTHLIYIIFSMLCCVVSCCCGLAQMEWAQWVHYV